MNYELIEKIEAQQKGKKNTAVWGVGEQLKEICENYPEAAELVSHDLDNADMSLEMCERQIKKYADEIHAQQRRGNVFVTQQKAEEIICKFYGINRENKSSGVVSLSDLM